MSKWTFYCSGLRIPDHHGQGLQYRLDPVPQDPPKVRSAWCLGGRTGRSLDCRDDALTIPCTVTMISVEVRSSRRTTVSLPPSILDLQETFLIIKPRCDTNIESDNTSRVIEIFWLFECFIKKIIVTWNFKI